MLQQQLVDMIVVEYTTAGYYMRTNELAAGTLTASRPIASVPVGFVYPEGSPLRALLDERLLRLFETRKLSEIQRQWFTPPAPQGTDVTAFQPQLVTPAAALLVLYGLLKLVQAWRICCKQGECHESAQYEENVPPHSQQARSTTPPKPGPST